MNMPSSNFWIQAFFSALTALISSIAVYITTMLPIWAKLAEAELERQKAISVAVESTEKARQAVQKVDTAVSYIIETKEKADVATAKLEEAIIVNSAAIQQNNDELAKFRKDVVK